MEMKYMHICERLRLFVFVPKLMISEPIYFCTIFIMIKNATTTTSELSTRIYIPKRPPGRPDLLLLPTDNDIALDARSQFVRFGYDHARRRQQWRW